MKKFALLFALSGFALTNLNAEDSAQVSLPQAVPAPAAASNASGEKAPNQSARKGKKHRKHHHKKKAESAPAPTP